MSNEWSTHSLFAIFFFHKFQLQISSYILIKFRISFPLLLGLDHFFIFSFIHSFFVTRGWNFHFNFTVCEIQKNIYNGTISSLQSTDNRFSNHSFIQRILSYCTPHHSPPNSLPTPGIMSLSIKPCKTQSYSHIIRNSLHSFNASPIFQLRHKQVHHYKKLRQIKPIPMPWSYSNRKSRHLEIIIIIHLCIGVGRVPLFIKNWK